MSSVTYVPGVRNLDAAETKQRRASGWIGLALTVIASGAFAYLHVSARWWLLLIFPVTMAALGFLQARSQFCVMVALSSRSLATTAADRSKDRSNALRMIAVAIGIGVVIAVGAWVVMRQGAGMAGQL